MNNVDFIFSYSLGFVVVIGLFLIFRFLVSQPLIKEFQKRQHVKLKNFIDENSNKVKDYSFGSEQFIKEREERFGYLTAIPGHIEFAFFGILTILLFQNQLSILEAGRYFFEFFGGWLAIKTVVSYDQWSHKIAGKAYYFVSLLAVFFNVFFSFLFGTLAYYLISGLLNL